jgi:anti-sigma-K factor RskA
MIHERQEELASLYALDLLEGAERADFEQSLAADQELQTLVRELREAAAGLAHTAPVARPPDALRSRVLATIAQPQAASRPATIERFPSSFARPLLPWAIAAGLAVTAGWFARLSVVNHADAERVRKEYLLAELALKQSQQELESERLVSRQQLAQLDLANLQIAALTAIAKDTLAARAVVVWNPARQEGVFALEQMPALSPDQRLELWLLEGEKPLSAGVFDVRAGEVTRFRFKPTAAVQRVAAFAVSREKNDGATSHATPGEVIMAGTSR